VVQVVRPCISRILEGFTHVSRPCTCSFGGVAHAKIASTSCCCALRSAPWIGGRPQPGLGKQIALDIARGLAFMHTHCIVHLVRADVLMNLFPS
jgi:hypothetical protein